MTTEHADFVNSLRACLGMGHLYGPAPEETCWLPRFREVSHTQPKTPSDKKPLLTQQSDGGAVKRFKWRWVRP